MKPISLLPALFIILSISSLVGCSSWGDNEFFPEYGLKEGDIFRIEITGSHKNSQQTGAKGNKIVALDTGEVIQLSLIGYDVEGNVNNNLDATWTSSNPQVAAVDSSGNVTALSGGEAEVTVKLMSSVTGEVISDTLVVNVLPSPVTNKQWTLAKTSLPQPIWDHGSAIWNGYLYVAGGHSACTAMPQRDCGFTNKVYYTKINPADGSIGKFSQTTLPSVFSGGLRGHTLLAYNGYLYLLGGIVHPTFTVEPYPDPLNFETILNEKVFYAKINPQDGSLGPWVETASLPPPEVTDPPLPPDKSGLFALSATVIGVSDGGKEKGYIYVTGGWSSKLEKNVRTVLVGPINEEGNQDVPAGGIERWIHNESSDLPYDLSKHTSVAVSVNGVNYLYVIGGNSGNFGSQTFHNDILYAKIAEDGILLQTETDGRMSTWRYASRSLPEPLIDHATVAAGRYIFVIGGRSGEEGNSQREEYNKFNKVIYFCVDDTGDVQSLQRSVDLPVPLFHHAAAADINSLDGSFNIYVTGGAGGDTKDPANRKDSVYYLSDTQ